MDAQPATPWLSFMVAPEHSANEFDSPASAECPMVAEFVIGRRALGPLRRATYWRHLSVV